MMDDNGAIACKLCGEAEYATQEKEGFRMPFADAVREAALALAYDFSTVTNDDLDDCRVSWACQPSIARLRELYPDATLEEAASASESCRAWAAMRENSAAILPLPQLTQGERG
jgi:hypothetical protein